MLVEVDVYVVDLGGGHLYAKDAITGVKRFQPTKGTVSAITSPDKVTAGYTYDGPLQTSESWSGRIAGSV